MFEPHLRLSLNGTIGNTGEIFSCNLSIEPQVNTWSAIAWAVYQPSVVGQWLAGNFGTNFEDLVADCVNFWGDPLTDIHAQAVLKTVKLAAIGPDGKYAAAPLEAARNVPGGAGDAPQNCPPWQISRKITLETDGDLGRVKGGFYLPLPIMAAATFDPATGLFTAERSTQVRDRVVTFLNDIANDPGFDAQDLKPVIASQGRHNKDGSVRLGPANHEVKRVNVGRRPDVQRRRANKRTEARPSDAAVSF